MSEKPNVQVSFDELRNAIQAVFEKMKSAFKELFGSPKKSMTTFAAVFHDESQDDAKRLKAVKGMAAIADKHEIDILPYLLFDVEKMLENEKESAENEGIEE